MRRGQPGFELDAVDAEGAHNLGVEVATLPVPAARPLELQTQAQHVGTTGVHVQAASCMYVRRAVESMLTRCTAADPTRRAAAGRCMFSVPVGNRRGGLAVVVLERQVRLRGCAAERRSFFER
jgi:hypothetical protein